MNSNRLAKQGRAPDTSGAEAPVSASHSLRMGETGRAVAAATNL